MEEQDLKKLIEKYLDGQCSEAEKELLEKWYAQMNDNNKLALSEQFLIRTGKKLKKSIFQRINNTETRKRFNSWTLAASIAGLFLMLSGFFYLWKMNRSGVATDVAPGGNKAILVLGDGSTVNLDSVGNGHIGLQSGSDVVKLNNGQLVYNSAGKDLNKKVTYNTLQVPLGGQYNLTLPDGTKVWLNAGSSLKFPASFRNLKDRRVFLEGEAYFEVFHDNEHPFYVNSGRQEARVLGTHFDIEAYPEDRVIKTTLLQGSLKVIGGINKDSCLLVPGKQAVLTEQLHVREVDVEDVVDWKDGYFIFNNETVQDILTRVARWYNVQIVYESHVENVKLDGIISKNTPLSEVLAMLSTTNRVNFKIRGKVLYVVK